MSSHSLPPARCPTTYEANKGLVGDMIPEIIAKMNWGTEERILDHGCGTGSTTFTQLLPVATSTNSSIYSFDNCKSMIDFASAKFPHPRISYWTGELSSTPSPFGDDLKFNKIFSLYTLHWIEDYKQELKALQRHLAPNGQMFISMILNAKFFQFFQQLKEHEKWGELAKRHLVIPQWLQEPGENSAILRKVLEEDLGLTVEYLEAGPKSYVFESSGQYTNLLFSMNPFVCHLPQNEQEELKELYHKFVHGGEGTSGQEGTDEEEVKSSSYTWTNEICYVLVRNTESH